MRFLCKAMIVFSLATVPLCSMFAQKESNAPLNVADKKQNRKFRSGSQKMTVKRWSPWRSASMCSGKKTSLIARIWYIRFMKPQGSRMSTLRRMIFTRESEVFIKSKRH
jgi:hypothetical protein